MKLETISIDKIQPAKYNPRKNLQPGDPDYEKLKKSITEFDLVEPLIMNKRGNVLIGGHQRLKILKEMGRTEVEVSVVDLPLAKEKALNLALNKISGEWDLPMLKDILQELDTGEFDIEITGFDSKEIEDLINQLHEPSEGLTDDDAIPDALEPICKPGDLWRLGNHRLLCGDATVEADVKRLMAGEKADMVFTDPPYNALKSWHKDEAKSETRLNPNKWFKNDNMEWPEFRAFLLSAVANYGGHSSYTCCDYRIYPLIVEVLTEASWDIKHCIVWKKNVWGLGKRYRFQHEFIVYSCRKDAPFYGDRSQSDIWEVDTDKGGEHNTPKPVGLTEIALRNSSQIKNIILDSFGGSGSTLIACEKLGRKCRMMEIDPHYCDVIITRWQNFTGKTAELLD